MIILKLIRYSVQLLEVLNFLLLTDFTIFLNLHFVMSGDLFRSEREVITLFS